MARKRFQRGCLFLRGKRKPVWAAQWREDIIEDGKLRRVLRKAVLGTKAEYPTKKLALRELENQLTPINNTAYRPRPLASFSQFAEKWQRNVLPNFKPSTGSPIRSQLAKHLVPTLGSVAMKDITAELLQSFVADCEISPKTIKNLIGTLRIMWKSAKAWNYVSHNPFDGLVLPEWETTEQPIFSRDDVQQILAKVDPHYWPVLWLVIQTGVRRGEACALNIGDVDFDRCFVEVRRSRFACHITNTKAKKPRAFPISPRLAARLRELAQGRGANEPMFLSKEGRRLHPDNFVARVITPVVKALGLKGGLHAFRHGNATAQDALGVPLKTRMEILGHVNTRTTMKYTHLLTDDVRRVPEMLDDYFSLEERILMPNDAKSNKEAFAPESQRLRIQ